MEELQQLLSSKILNSTLADWKFRTYPNVSGLKEFKKLFLPNKVGIAIGYRKDGTVYSALLTSKLQYVVEEDVSLNRNITLNELMFHFTENYDRYYTTPKSIG